MKTRTTNIILIVALLVLVCGNAIAVVQGITKGTPVNWGQFSMAYCCLSCLFAGVSAKKKVNN